MFTSTIIQKSFVNLRFQIDSQIQFITVSRIDILDLNTVLNQSIISHGLSF